jgi:multidrug efflux system membrane fusion protein
MRLAPIITATVVSVLFYLITFQRENLLAFAGIGQEEVQVENAPEPAAGTAPTPAPGAEPAPTKTDRSDERQVAVQAVHSTAQEVDSAVILRGRTEAARSVTVMSELSGLVISEPLRKGAMVRQGQLLCQIDPGTRLTRLAEAKAQVPGAQAQLTGARASLEEAQINATAAERLSEGGFAAETRVKAANAALESAKAAIQAAQAGLESAHAAVASAQDTVDRLQITAPFDGLLESDAAELGSLLQPGAPCATIIQLDPIKLVGFVPETSVARVGLGADAGARLSDGQMLRGQVTFISRSADEATRTFRVEITVPNPDGKVSDGITAEILIASAGAQAHLLPGSALTLNDHGTLGVRTVTADRRALFKPVTVIRDTADGVWLAGLNPAEDVIVVGQEYVTDGVAVIPTFKEAAQ